MLRHAAGGATHAGHCQDHARQARGGSALHRRRRAEARGVSNRIAIPHHQLTMMIGHSPPQHSHHPDHGGEASLPRTWCSLVDKRRIVIVGRIVMIVRKR